MPALVHEDLVAETLPCASPASASRCHQRRPDHRSPITGGGWPRARAHSKAEVAAIVGDAQGSLRDLAFGTGAGSWPAGARAGRVASRTQGPTSDSPRLHRSRARSASERAGRGPGNDRHLRPGRPGCRVSCSGLRDSQRAPRPPDDGAVAPARGHRRDQRVQLPCRGLVVEQALSHSCAVTPWSGSRQRRRC